MNNAEENNKEDLKEEIIESERESKDTVALGDIPEEQLDKRSCLKRTFGKMNPGSLRGSNFQFVYFIVGYWIVSNSSKNWIYESRFIPHCHYIKWSC